MSAEGGGAGCPRTGTLSTQAALTQLPDAAWDQEYPEAVGGATLPTGVMYLVHLASHLAFHLGQAGYLRRQMNEARGYSQDTVLEWIYRYARQARLVDGASEVHKAVLARFLRHMVRAIAGTLAEIGTGLRPVSAMGDILKAGDRRAAGATALACGLTLLAVKYA